MNYTGTGYQIPKEEYYEQRSVGNSNVIFCQHCGAVNHIFEYEVDYLYCAVCGKEL